MTVIASQKCSCSRESVSLLYVRRWCDLRKSYCRDRNLVPTRWTAKTYGLKPVDFGECSVLHSDKNCLCVTATVSGLIIWQTGYSASLPMGECSTQQERKTDVVMTPTTFTWLLSWLKQVGDTLYTYRKVYSALFIFSLCWLCSKVYPCASSLLDIINEVRKFWRKRLKKKYWFWWSDHYGKNSTLCLSLAAIL